MIIWNLVSVRDHYARLYRMRAQPRFIPVYRNFVLVSSLDSQVEAFQCLCSEKKS